MDSDLPTSTIAPTQPQSQPHPAVLPHGGEAKLYSPATNTHLDPGDPDYKLARTSSHLGSDSESSLIPTPLAAPITLPISPKAKVLKRISTEIDINDFGLIAYFYRADLVPMPMEAANPNNSADTMAFDFDAEFRAALQTAIVELDYSQGFPALPNGEPFWHQLPHETDAAYRAFVHYLDMPRIKGTHNGAVNATNAVRQVHTLKTTVGLPPHELLTMSYLYYWQQRALAYDFFITAAHSKKREYMLQDVENEHLRLAESYLRYTEDYLTQVFQDPDKYGLSPKDAISLMTKMIQVQRISLGASPTGEKGNKEGGVPSGAPLEVILRTLVQQAGITSTTGAKEEDLTKQLFNNPKDLAQAQELIIRMGNAKNPRAVNPLAPLPAADRAIDITPTSAPSDSPTEEP